MKVIVYGCGQMGTCLTYRLYQLGYQVEIYDDFEEQMRLAKQKLHQFFNVNVAADLTQADAIISATMFEKNIEIATHCLENNIPYFDLGGDPKTDHAIYELSKKFNGTVFCSLGLAPGMVNIIAESMIKEGTNTVKMRVGGLPKNPTNRLKYNTSWSPEGLANEYLGEYDVVRNGKLERVSTLDGVETLELEGNIFEAFYTKGAVATSLNTSLARGIQNIDYKTIRYPGHNEYLKFMVEDLGLNNVKTFANYLQIACPPTKEDVVWVYVQVDEEKRYLKIEHDEHWTAMQKATAFPAAAVVHLFLSGCIPRKNVLTYADVPFEEFKDYSDF